MEIFETVILGIVQGLTEFLPVSSSGHLAIGHFLFGAESADVMFDVILHVATLAAVLVFYRRDLLELVRGFFKPRIPGTSWFSMQNWSHMQGRGLILQILLATVVTSALGLTFKDFFESLFTSKTAVGLALCINAGILYLSRMASRGKKDLIGPGIKGALLIGLFQAAAITPGISRSGITISLALLLGLEKTAAVRFSFLLAIPAICGAMLLKLVEGVSSGYSFTALTAGFIASATVGFAALIMLVKLTKSGKLFYFAPYTLVLGALLIIWGLF